MMRFKRLTAIALSAAMLTAMLTGCGDETTTTTTGSKSDSSESSKSETPAADELGEPAPATGKMLNFTAPKEGEDVIAMTIKDYGTVKIKLFPEQAPKGVANFKALADKGYYNGLIFHRIINNFMIQGGDPLGSGIGGECIWGDKFDGGTSEDLNHVAGAVAYANSGSTATNGSQFYIVTGDTYTKDQIVQLEAQGYNWNDEAEKAYTKQGGAPWLDGSYTIFGQVFDGLDIVFKIQEVETDASDKPAKDVVIEKIEVEKYDGGKVRFNLSDY